MKESKIVISNKAEKSLSILPDHILKMFKAWEEIILNYGYSEMKKIPGYRDHELKGRLEGLRSVSLNRSYRVIYRLEEDEVLIVKVIEVNKHDYKI